MIKEAYLEQIMRVVVGKFVLLKVSDKLFKESVLSRKGDVEIKLIKDVILHLKYVLFGISPISYKNIVIQLWRVDLFILGSNHECCHSNQLKISFFNQC